MSLRCYLVGFCLLAGAVQAAEPRLPSQSLYQTVQANTVLLPLSGMVVSAGASGTLRILSTNGRYLFKGQLYDNWNDQFIESLSDAQASRNTISRERLKLDSSDLAPIQFGQGAELVVFVDAQASLDQRNALSTELKVLSADHQITVLPIPKVRPPAVCEPADQRWLAALAEAAVRYQCDAERYLKRLFTAHLLHIDELPFFYRADGFIRRGMPSTAELAGWLQGGKP